MFFTNIRLAPFNAELFINIEPDQEPNQKTDPGIKWQEGHHSKANEYTQSRDIGHKGYFKSTRHVLHFITRHQYTKANQDEGKQSTDANHFPNDPPRYKSRERTDQPHKQKIGFVGCVVFGMNFRKQFGQ